MIGDGTALRATAELTMTLLAPEAFRAKESSFQKSRDHRLQFCSFAVVVGLIVASLSLFGQTGHCSRGLAARNPCSSSSNGNGNLADHHALLPDRFHRLELRI